jgi:hypothetical protein
MPNSVNGVNLLQLNLRKEKKMKRLFVIAVALVFLFCFETTVSAWEDIYL